MQPPEMFCEKGVLRNFAKFRGKYLCLRPATLLKKTLETGVFLWILWNFEEHLFLQSTSGGCSYLDNLMKKYPGYQKDRLVNLKIYLASYWKYRIGQNVIGQNFCRTKFLVGHKLSQNLFLFVRLKIYFIFTWYYGHTQRTGQWYSKKVVSWK